MRPLEPDGAGLFQRIGRLPWVVQLPLIGGIMIFMVAVGTSQLAMHWVFDIHAADIRSRASGHVESVAAAMEPFAMVGDTDNLHSIARHMLASSTGLATRRLVVLDADGQVRVAVPELTDRLPPGLVIRFPAQWIENDADDSAWLSRPIGRDGEWGHVAANLDFGQQIAEREALRVKVVALDLALSAMCGLAGALLIRRMMRPIMVLTRRFDTAIGELPAPLAETEMPPPETELGRFVRGLNRMIAAAREREILAARLADQERAVLMGRLAATVAHEIRNPLGGMVNTLDTLRRFGEDPKVRSQSLNLLERGFETIGNVVQMVLLEYRAPESGRNLARDDLADLRLLLDPEAKRRQIRLDWQVDMPDEVPVDAVPTRQIILNLLLNACAATPVGGQVRFTALIDGESLLLTISDQGPGLPDPVADRFRKAGWENLEGGGMGVAVVMRLVERLQGRVSVQSAVGRGTDVHLFLPIGQSGLVS
jgi:signal transduction histidine kinase